MTACQSTSILNVLPLSRAPPSHRDSGRSDLPKATTRQHTGAGQAFRRYNARLDRDKPD
jgi:hypothetical protein